jgi:hypothetical protein
MNAKQYILDRSLEIGDCWIWQQSTDKNGYGCACFNGVYLGAHRLSFMAFVGEIPSGIKVLHTCDIPSCVRPQHLFLGSHQDNMDDMVKKGRSAKGVHMNTGSAHGSAVLTEDQVLLIRKLCEEGRSQNSVEREFGLSKGLVNKIVRRKLWTHI